MNWFPEYVKAGTLGAALLLVTFSVAAEAAMVDTAWVRLYDGLSSMVDRARDVVVDASGNVIVTGHSQGLAPPNPWNDNDAVTIKYKPNGDTAWVRRFDPSGDSTETGLLIKNGVGDTVYVAGTSGDGTSTDILLIKYAPNGDTVWSTTYDGANGLQDVPIDMAVDPGGRVYLTAQTHDGTHWHWLTIKFEADGSVAWADEVGSSTVYEEQPVGLAFATFNVYVTGNMEGTSGDLTLTTIQYSIFGGANWTREYPGATNSTAADIVTGPIGDAFVLGNLQMSSSEWEWLLLRYDTSGDTAWVTKYHGAGNGVDVAGKVAIDASFNVILVGEVWTTGSTRQITLVKYNSTALLQWAKPVPNIGQPDEMAVDASGNIYMCGSGLPPGSIFNQDWGTVCHLPNGDTAWFRWLLNGITPVASNYPEAIALDQNNSVIVCGGFVAGFAPGPTDYCSVMYTQSCCVNRGNVDGIIGPSGPVDISDLSYLVAYLFSGGPAPPCLEEGNVDNITGPSGPVDISDLSYLVAFLFSGGPPPPSC